MNRREIIQATAGGLLAASFGAGRSLPAAEAADGFYFLAVNDTHYVDDHCRRWLEKAFAQMRSHAEKPAFCLLLGDLVEDGDREPLSGIRKLIDDFGLPTYAVPGNHDYARDGSRAVYDELFPNRLNYHFEHQGWRFVGLDTTQKTDYRDTSVQPATLQWLDETMPQLDREPPLVLFTHFPLGPGVTYRPKNADEVLSRFRNHNLRAVFSGHFHGMTERTVNGVPLVTNRCAAISRKNHDGSTVKGYYLCHARGNAVTRRFIELPR